MKSYTIQIQHFEATTCCVDFLCIHLYSFIIPQLCFCVLQLFLLLCLPLAVTYAFCEGRTSLILFSSFALPTSSFLCCYVPKFSERGIPCFVLFFSETLRQPGSGTVSVVAQQSSLRHCIWYRSVQINLSWLVCNYIIVTRPGCVWIRVVLLYTVSQPKTSLSHDLLLFVLLSAY